MKVRTILYLQIWRKFQEVTSDGVLVGAELDRSNTKVFNESRMMLIARGSGRLVREVMEMLEMMEQDKRAQDPKEWRHECILEKHERSAHEQGPPSSDAQADWWHGWSAESNETDGFGQGHDGNVGGKDE
ncbi:hypothetical protein Rs2_23357 [Raphanus sativus]|nr:hypothetical protein Rs2_23357 [Raphanus sativus]